MKLVLFNVESGNERRRGYAYPQWILAFGAYGWTQVMVSARTLDDALETCADWIADHAPGLFCDEQVAEEYRAAIAEGLSEEAAQERAEQDTTSVDCGHYLLSYEWTIVAENPDRATLKALCADGVEVY